MTEQEQADYYGLTLEQFRDVKAAIDIEWIGGMSNKLFAYFLKYPESAWRRMISAAVDMRRMPS